METNPSVCFFGVCATCVHQTFSGEGVACHVGAMTQRSTGSGKGGLVNIERVRKLVRSGFTQDIRKSLPGEFDLSIENKDSSCTRSTLLVVVLARNPPQSRIGGWGRCYMSLLL